MIMETKYIEIEYISPDLTQDERKKIFNEIDQSNRSCICLIYTGTYSLCTINADGDLYTQLELPGFNVIDKKDIEDNIKSYETDIKNLKSEYDKNIKSLDQQCKERIKKAEDENQKLRNHISELEKIINDTPKRNGCCEWISAKTLLETLKIITNKKDE